MEGTSCHTHFEYGSDVYPRLILIITSNKQGLQRLSNFELLLKLSDLRQGRV